MDKIEKAGYMRKAIHFAYNGSRAFRGGPFGACLVKNGIVIASGANTVLRGDPTAHAEINAIRAAAKVLKTHDLSGCVIFSTTEPCPMCFAAIHWAKIRRVYYGTSIGDAAKLGFNELPISNARMKKIGRSPVVISGGFLRDECRKLLDDWRDIPGVMVY